MQRLEAEGVVAFLAAMGALPLDLASAAGGAVARIIGPRLAVTRRARRNLDIALPHLSAAGRRRVIREMWDNLGRTTAEYAHLSRLRCFAPGARVEVVGTEHIDRAVARGKPLIFFSGHLGNWEVASVAVVQYGVELVQIYRAANNPDVEAMLLQ
jgi:KDO2-lipid IV(A) lauroyltransferase